MLGGQTTTTVVGVVAIGTLAALATWWARQDKHTTKPSASSSPKKLEEQEETLTEWRLGMEGLVGNTPMVRIASLSNLTQCTILAKAEFLNVGGSSKDRVALRMVQDAERQGLITPNTGCTLFEGTVGSTGIALALVARAKGYKCHIVMPDDQSVEKYALLERLGAVVTRVRPVSIIDKDHFVRIAERRAAEMNENTMGPRALYANQFENPSNFQVHYETTGPEIYAQTKGMVDAFVMGAGTGGTLSGVSRFLKEQKPSTLIVLADPDGSGLFNKVKHNIMFASTETEGTRKRHQVDTVVEGIGLNRITANFSKGMACIDDAVRVTDQEAVSMSRYLVAHDGLFVGSSSSVNCAAAVQVARALGPGHTIVTVLCDSGTRHLSKFWNDDYLKSIGLNPTLDFCHKI